MKKLNDIENKIAEAISKELDFGNADNEPFYTEVEVGDFLIEVRGHYWTESYCEDDYYNGTGGWITTDASVLIDELNAYNENGDEVELNINESLVCEELENELKAA